MAFASARMWLVVGGCSTVAGAILLPFQRRGVVFLVIGLVFVAFGVVIGRARHSFTDNAFQADRRRRGQDAPGSIAIAKRLLHGLKDRPLR